MLRAPEVARRCSTTMVCARRRCVGLLQAREFAVHCGGAWSRPRFALEHGSDQRIEATWPRVLMYGHRRRWFADTGCQHRARRRASVRRMTSEQLVKNAPEAVDVAGGFHRPVAHQEFGTHV